MCIDSKSLQWLRMTATPCTGTYVGVLEPQELKRRIDAARRLRGLRQIDLAELLEADGHGKTDVGRLERGELRFSPSLRRSLAYHLGVSEGWFTAVNVDDVLGRGGDAGDDLATREQLDEVTSRLAGLEEKLVARTEHDRLVEGMLERQTKILKQIELLVASFPTDDRVDELARILRGEAD